MVLRLKLIKWLGLTPLTIPNITVDLVTKPFTTQPIEYGGIEVGEPTKVGTHTKKFDNFIS